MGIDVKKSGLKIGTPSADRHSADFVFGTCGRHLAFFCPPLLLDFIIAFFGICYKKKVVGSTTKLKSKLHIAISTRLQIEVDLHIAISTHLQIEVDSIIKSKKNCFQKMASCLYHSCQKVIFATWS